MKDFERVESTGKGMREFSTGSVRDDETGKGRWDLIPYEPMRRLAVHYENGAKKYGDRNWEKGQPLDAYLRSAMRHLSRFINGENGEDHLSAVIWNVMGFIFTENEVIEGRLPSELTEKLHPIIKERILKAMNDNTPALEEKRFQKGDRVKIVKKVDSVVSNWVLRMDSTIGKKGVVRSVDNCSEEEVYGVEVSGELTWYYVAESLEKL